MFIRRKTRQDLLNSATNANLEIVDLKMKFKALEKKLGIRIKFNDAFCYVDDGPAK